MNKFLNICSAINPFQLHCRWLIKNFQAQIYLAIHSLYLAYQSKFASQILFNLYVLTVNLNFHYSSKTLRLEQIVCVAYACSPWIMVIMAFVQNGYKLWQKNNFQHESSVFGPRLPRDQSKFSNKQTNQIQSLPLKQNGKHHKCVYEQKLKRVPTYFICFIHFNGTELTVIYFVNIPFSMQKGRFLSLNPLLNAGGVISV